MNSRITETLALLKQKKQKAFIPFITAGFPNLKTTEQLIYTLEKAGANVIELGVPFTDPMADGPVIQKANEVALEKGVTLKDILKLVRQVRKKTNIAILLMGYYNPIFQFGLENFAKQAYQAGVDGLLIVDLPVEEAAPLRKVLQDKPIDIIYLLTPTSTKKRIELINKHGSGFVYYVSYTGITGANRLNVSKIKSQVQKIRKQVQLPLNIGFGISTVQDVKRLSPLADGIIVGSAILKLMGKSSPSQVNEAVSRFVKKMVSGLSK